MKFVTLDRNERGVFTRIPNVEALLDELRDDYSYLENPDEALVRARADFKEMYDTDGKSLEDILLSTTKFGSPYHRGKVCFPTKSCAPYLCEGHAEIDVVSEKETFAFFTGRMVQYSQPSDAALLRYIIEKGLEDAVFVRKVGSLRGDYIKVVVGQQPYLLVGEGLVAVHEFVDVQDKGVEKERFSGRDFICQMKHGCDFATFADNLRKAVQPYNFGSQYQRFRIEYEFDERLTKYVQERVCDVLVHTHRKTVVHSVDMRTKFDSQVLQIAVNHSPEELAEFISIVNQVNAEANAATEKFLNRKRGG